MNLTRIFVIIFIIVFSLSLHAQTSLVICFDTSGSMRYRLIPTLGTCEYDLNPDEVSGNQHPDTRYRIALEVLNSINTNLLSPLFLMIILILITNLFIIIKLYLMDMYQNEKKN